MNCIIPENWEYDVKLEMLYLFYQYTDELLSEITPATYALPMHNVLTLVDEANTVTSLLERNKCIDKFYLKYVTPIIEELICAIQNDYLIKRIIGARLNSIISGLHVAEQNSSVLNQWLSLIHQTVSLDEYKKSCEREIIKLIMDTEKKEKQKLETCIKNYYITLMCFGYSREYIYMQNKRFFNNHAITINNSNQIIPFLQSFTCKPTEFTFYMVIDMDNIEYIDEIHPGIKNAYKIEVIDVDSDLRNLAKKESAIKDLLNCYDRLKESPKDHSKIVIAKVVIYSMDPYQAIILFNEDIRFLQIFKRYFIHHKGRRQLFHCLLMDSNKYVRIEPHTQNKSRPFIEDELINSRISNILKEKSLGHNARVTITHALEMHAEALDTRSASTMIKTLWTAMEALFLDYTKGEHENIEYCILHVIQKTYILKLLRAIYGSLELAIGKDTLATIEIVDFPSFVRFFSIHASTSSEMKGLYTLLGDNPLLRSRIFNLRQDLNDGNSIMKFLTAHETRIKWQLKRIFRIRNIATHVGEEIDGIETAVCHLHDYFDYIVNYVLCKLETKTYVPDIASIAFEAKNDNEIHHNLLKNNDGLNADNYLSLLFGPDTKIIQYVFEF